VWFLILLIVFSLFWFSGKSCSVLHYCKSLCTIIPFIFITETVAAGTLLSDADYDTIKHKLLKKAMNASDYENYLAQKDSIINTQKRDGSWPDLLYQTEALDDDNFHLHLERTRAMVFMQKSRLDAGKTENRQINRKIQNAINYWIEVKPYSSDRHLQYTIIPALLYEILLAGKGVLEPESIESLLGAIPQMGYPIHIMERLPKLSHQLMHAIITSNDDQLLETRKGISELSRIRVAEGIQPDFSFHAEGPELHMGSYGIKYVEKIAWFIYLFKDTDLRFEDEEISFLLDFILEGHQWMVFGHIYDPRARAHKVSEQNYNVEPLIRALKYLKEADFWNEELRLLELKLNKQTGPLTGTVQGNRVFWRSDFLVHRRENYYAALKYISSRTNSAGTIDGMGLKNYYFYDGSLLVMKEGKEYEGLYPAWNWRKIPGVTCEISNSDPPSSEPKRTLLEFSGAVSDGHFGLAAMSYHKDSVYANKSWFFFNDGIVCMGNELQMNLYGFFSTSIEQNRLQGKVFYGYRNRIFELPAGQQYLPAVEWIKHNQTVYQFLQPGGLQVYTGPVEGNWNSLNDYEESRDVEDSIFSLWINHEKNEDSTYQYLIVPFVEDDALNYYRSNDYKVIQNDKKIQAVSHREDQMLQAVFYTPGLIEWDESKEIYADSPCLLMLRLYDGYLWISVADPLQQQSKINIEINMKFLDDEEITWNADRGTSIIEITFPKGVYSGSSVNKNYSFLRGWE
jgi:chondroitin AC lyase